MSLKSIAKSGKNLLQALRPEEILSLALTAVSTLLILILQGFRGYSAVDAATDMLEYFSFGNSFFSFFFLALWVIFAWKLFQALNYLAGEYFVSKVVVTKVSVTKAFAKVWQPLRLLWPLALFTIPLFGLLGIMSKQLHTQAKDIWLNSLDNSIFGSSPFLRLPTTFQAPWFETIIEFSYVYLAQVVAGTLILCLFLKKPLLIRRFTMAFLLSLAIGFPIYFVVPCQDPNNYFVKNLTEQTLPTSIQTELSQYSPSSRVQRMTNRISEIELYSHDGAAPISCFPSDHAVWSMLTLYILAVLTPWSLIVTLPWLFCVLTGGIYFGQHYFVDYVMGLVVAIACILISNRLIRPDQFEQKK